MSALAPVRTVRPVLVDAVIPRRIATDIGLIAGGAAVVALFAQVSFWIGPVPITGQTLGVLLVGATLGSVRGAISLASYVGLGLAGLPIFAAHAGGIGYVAMPSFGFLLGFIPAAYVIGWLAERRWDRHPLRALAAFGAASVIPFLVGVPYLAAALAVLDKPHDLATVMAAGVIPFIVPGLIKWGVAAAVLPLAWRGVNAIERRSKN